MFTARSLYITVRSYRDLATELRLGGGNVDHDPPHSSLNFNIVSNIVFLCCAFSVWLQQARVGA